MKKLLLLSIFFLAIFVRLYNFENRINFGLEQALPLITSASYLEKPSLLGLESVRRSTSLGHSLYFAPFFTYSLVPLILISNHNPLIVTAFFAFINLATGVLLFLLVKRVFSERVATWSAFLFLFNTVMISHSLFIWINNYTPLITVAILYLLWRLKKDDFKFAAFAIGTLAGINTGLEYIYLLLGVPFVIATLLLFSKKRLKNLLLFALGFALINFPTILFDVKHDFYHLRTLFQYLIDTLNSSSPAPLEYMHFLQFWPVAAIAGALLIDSLYKKRKLLVGPILGLYLVLNLTSTDISFDKAIGMPEGLNYRMLERAARTIAADSSSQFNVATTFDLDSRAHPLRYLLEFRYNKKPQGVIEYPNSQTLYVFAESDYNFSSAPWEITSFNAKTLEAINISNGYTIYKMTK